MFCGLKSSTECACNNFSSLALTLLYNEIKQLNDTHQDHLILTIKCILAQRKSCHGFKKISFVLGLLRSNIKVTSTYTCTYMYSIEFTFVCCKCYPLINRGSYNDTLQIQQFFSDYKIAFLKYSKNQIWASNL